MDLGPVRAQLQPLLERGDAGSRVPQVHLALEPVQRLQALDGVALHRGADALPDGAKEVHEDALAQQPVHLQLARPVPAHQAAHGRWLVRRVVVDVETRIGLQAADEEVDEGLERPAFGVERDVVALDRPPGMERRLAIGPHEPRLEHPEEVVDPVVQGERVAFDVEEQVAGRRGGKAQQPAVGFEGAIPQAARREALGQHERPDGVALRLDARLLAHARKARRGRALERRSHRQGQPAQRGAGRHVPRPQRRPLMGGDAGHQREVVRLAAPRLTFRPPAADLAVLDWVRPRGWRVLGGSPGAFRESLELAPDRPDVGGVVGDAQVIHIAGAAAERHVHQLRAQALENGELLRVQAQLQHRRALGVPRELRVPDLVAPRPELARRLDAAQEVGEAKPPPVEERGLVDDRRPGAHGGHGRFRRGAIARPAVSLRNVDLLDAETLRTEAV